MTAIYKPGGKAGEYSPLACNLADGCAHGCVYCYAARIAVAQNRFIDIEDFRRNPRIRPQVLQEVEKDAKAIFNRRGLLGPDPGAVMLCFMTDPFQPLAGLAEVTEVACGIIADNGLTVKLLTKAAGSAALGAMQRLAEQKGRHWFGISLTTFNQNLADAWEPGAAPVYERLFGLDLAMQHGLNTWVSMEPVIWPAETLNMVQQLADMGVINHFAVGLLSRREELPIGLPQPADAGVGGLALRQDIERILTARGYTRILDGARPPAGEKTYYLKQGM